MIDVSRGDLAVIALLVFLEGVLSIDNAVVLALLANRLPKAQQKKALTYGLLGAVVFRLIAISIATYLMRWTWVKFVGGGYLCYVAVKHLFFGEGEASHSSKAAKSFWRAVIVIELTDIAFAVDSILAAVAMTTKFWVVFTGGFLGLVLMRFAATLFIKLLEKFPNFQISAYLLVLLIGLKLIIDGFQIPGVNFHTSESPAFWAFWMGMLICLLVGFVRRGSSRR